MYVLCRTNGEVLVVSGLLRERGVVHRVQRASASMVPPRWIAETLGQHGDPRLSRRAFQRLTEDAEPQWQTEAWRVLRRVAAGTGDDVELPRLRERIRSISEHEAPDRTSPGAPVVSTVHRAKGLEFDRVVLLEPQLADADSEEARVLFVAMTRARDETMMLERPQMSFRLQQRHARWTAVPWRRRGLLAVEIRPGDVDRERPFTSVAEAAAVQRHLIDCVRPGDPITLIRRPGERPEYNVVHGAQPIARTNAGFALELERMHGDVPNIEDVCVDSLSSAAGDPSMTSNLGLGSGGLWLVPELVGLGRLIWRTE